MIQPDKNILNRILAVFFIFQIVKRNPVKHTDIALNRAFKFKVSHIILLAAYSKGPFTNNTTESGETYH